jgi:hypothetical protein
MTSARTYIHCYSSRNVNDFRGENFSTISAQSFIIELSWLVLFFGGFIAKAREVIYRSFLFSFHLACAVLQRSIKDYHR